MSVYVRCLHCKTDQNVSNKVCVKCGKKIGRKDRVFRVKVIHQGKTVTKMVHGSLELAKQIEAKIKSSLVDGEYFKKNSKRKILYSDFMEKKYASI
jgi:uncharacterized lipoprotein YmbA